MGALPAPARTRRIAGALLTAALSLWLAANAQAGQTGTGQGGDLVLTLREGPARAEKAGELAARVGGRVVAAIPQIGAYLVDLADGTAVHRREAADRLESRRAVRHADPSGTLRILASPQTLGSDPYRSRQWHLATIRAASAWGVSTGSPDAVIAIVDTGVDYTHPDLAGKVTLGPDFGSGDSNPRDTNGHGTHVAGIAAAATGNGVGVSGVCPDCKLLAVKVFPDRSGSTSDFAVAQGVVWATDNGADVVNLSLGGPGGSSVLRGAVDYAAAHGVLVVAAAGNTGDDTTHYPAAYDTVVAVAATTSSDARARYSTYGWWVDVAAPGSGILSTVPGGGYASWSGTSMASPVVAGAAALTLSALGGTAVSVRAALESGVIDLGAPGLDQEFGHGRIDLSLAVAGAEGPGGDDPPAPVGPVDLTTTTLPAATVGAPYAVTLDATGGVTPYRWSLTGGTLPTGVGLDRSTGEIAGTPTQAGAFPITVTVTDGARATDSASYTLTVAGGGAGAALPDLTVGWKAFAIQRTVRATLEVRATGPAGTSLTQVPIRVSVIDGSGRAVETRTVTLRSVTVGTTSYVSLSLSLASRGLTARATVDPGNAFAEADEANNTADSVVP